MELPNGIWVDNSGNVFIADHGNNRIRKVDAVTHTTHTFAGGSYGTSPSGTLAAGAAFNSISGVCADNAGNVYISDQGNHIVRMVDRTGRLWTVAGTNTAGYSGDGGPALNAQLGSPAGLFINSANHLFICDIGSNVVRVVDMNTGMINTLAGTGNMGFSGDGGSPVSAQLNQPSGVWQDASGVIYIADAGNNRIRTITGSGYRGVTQTNIPSEDQFKIFPNPSAGMFTIQTGTALSNASVEVYNVFGQKVYTGNVSHQLTSIDLNQPSGIYNIVLRSASGVTTQKVNIEK